VGEDPDGGGPREGGVVQSLGYLPLAVARFAAMLGVTSLADQPERGSREGDYAEAQLEPSVALGMPRRELVEKRYANTPITTLTTKPAKV
jgi:hypothetical protein